MFKKSLTFFGLFTLLAGLLLFIARPVTATPQAQVYYQTPTPDADGRIIYVVGPKETCLQIQLKTGINVSEIIAMNKLDANCTIMVGAKLLLKVVTQVSATPGPSPTPTPALPTATPFNGNGQVCVLLFGDINGNAVPDGNEVQLKGGAVSLSDQIGKISLTGKTPGGTDPLCFAEVPEGSYNISVAPPDGYNATTIMNYPLKLAAGEKTQLDFGAQPSSSPQEATPSSGSSSASSGTSPLLSILGAIMVLGGAGLGIYFWRLRR